VKVAIVISEFPCSDEVFILRELRSLAQGGLDLEIRSLRRPAEAALHVDAALLAGRARYSPFFWSREVWRRNLELLVREPGLYARLLGTILREMRRSLPLLWRSLALFPLAVRWGMELRADPVTRIHAHWATHPSTAAWVMSRISGIPFSLTAHAHDIYLDQAMLAFKLRAAAAVLTCTGQNRDFLRSLAPELPAERIRLSYHGVDLQAYQPASAPPETFRVLSVGTLLPRKGFDVLLEACAILESEGVAHECLIVGDGPQRMDLEGHAVRLGLSGTRFLGKRSQEELPVLYRLASVFVLAAIHGAPAPGPQRARMADRVHFGIPNVILEAMASGLPVVATRMPALAEVLEDGENGLYVPERDPRALAEVLRGLAAHPARRARLGERAAKRIRADFDLQATAADVAAALGAPLRQACSGSAGRRSGT
jgi:glycosyltransferase involved in cell wall biosynthesis